MDATWIITTFVLTDTIMTHLDHQTDVRAGVPDSEIVTVALVATKYFANNHRIALTMMRQLQYLSGTISHSQLKAPPRITQLDGSFARSSIVRYVQYFEHLY